MNGTVKSAALDKIVDYLNDQVKRIVLLDNDSLEIKTIIVSESSTKVVLIKDYLDSTSSKLILQITIDGSDFTIPTDSTVDIKKINVYDQSGTEPMFSVEYTNVLQLGTTEDQIVVNIDIVSQT